MFKLSASIASNAELLRRFRSLFTDRHLIFHDGRGLRRFRIGARAQAAMAGIAVVTVSFSAYGVASAAANAAEATGIVETSPDVQLQKMHQRMLAMRADVERVKKAAALRAEQLEKRQALIAAVLTGEGDPEALAAAVQPVPGVEHLPADVASPLARVEQRQLAFAAQARQATEARYATAARQLRKLGIRPERFRVKAGAMGGPFEPAEISTGGGSPAAAEANAEAQFRSLFLSWKKLDTLEQAAISIPSLQPVENITLSSNFGVRSDPFRGTAAMHAGIDIPGPLGTPVYATADGIVGRAERAGGYGNLVEINHGKGIETRYGHLSKILVAPNTRVRRGQLIGLMGSTGRSTGSHLHYEVRIDGRAVNPIPYLQAGDHLLAAQDRARVAQGGPAS